MVISYRFMWKSLNLCDDNLMQCFSLMLFLKYNVFLSKSMKRPVNEKKLRDLTSKHNFKQVVNVKFHIYIQHSFLAYVRHSEFQCVSDRLHAFLLFRWVIYASALMFLLSKFSFF